MKLNWAQPLIGMDLEECYIVFLPGHQLIYTFNIQFTRFRVIFYIFLTDYNNNKNKNNMLSSPLALCRAGENDRKDGAIVSKYNPTNKSDELKIDRK